MRKSEPWSTDPSEPPCDGPVWPVVWVRGELMLPATLVALIFNNSFESEFSLCSGNMYDIYNIRIFTMVHQYWINKQLTKRSLF